MLHRTRTIRIVGVAFAVVTLAMMLGLQPVRQYPPARVVYAGENIWTWTGVAGDAPRIVTNPLDPLTVYAFVRPVGLMKSSDGGSSWSHVDLLGISGNDILHVALAPSAPDTLYVTTYDGIYRSDNGGTKWVRVNEGLGRVSVSPVDWRDAYLAAGTVLMKTADGGDTWEDISDTLPSSCKPMNGALAIAPSAPHIALTRGGNQGGISCRTTDNGRTWTPLTTAPYYQNTIVFDPGDSQTIYIGSNLPGGWKSTDGGDTWMPLAGGLYANGWEFVVNPDNTQVLYAANGESGVVESVDGGITWSQMDTGIQGLYVRSIAAGGRSPLTVYAGTYGAGVWEMTRTTIQDYGITVNEGALFTNDTAVMLTLTAPPGTTQMMISNDGGFGGAAWEAFSGSKTWTLTGHGSYVLPRTVYAKFMTNGQVSGQYQDDIILDQTAPTGTVHITDTLQGLSMGQPTHLSEPTGMMTDTVYLPMVNNNMRPGLRLIGLALSATDDLSGVGEMLVANNSAFTGAEWQPYAPKTNWWVPDTATITVYVKYRDRAGNASQLYTATTTAP